MFNDANDSLKAPGIHSLIKSLSDAMKYPLVGVFNAVDINEEIDDLYLNGFAQGSKLEMPEFDQLLSFHLGYLTTITGIPSHGKSEVLDFITTLLNIHNEWKFGLYSPENYPLQLHFSKYAEKLIGKPFRGYNRMNQAELALAKQHHAENFYFIKPEEDFTIYNILGSVKKLIKKHGINAFVIDAYNKLENNFTLNESQ